MDISIYLHDSLMLPPLWDPSVADNKVFDEQNFVLGDQSDKRLVSVEVPLSDKVRNNGTLWAHILIAKAGAVIDPTDERYDTSKAYRQVKLLTRYMSRKKVIKTKKLIGATAEEIAAQEEEPDVPVVDALGNPIIQSYWHSNLTLDVVGNGQGINYMQTAPPIKQYIRLAPPQENNAALWYYPVVFVNDFWLLREHMVEINSTVT